jgi:hypothetical protein
MKDGWVTESMFFSTALQSVFDAFSSDGSGFALPVVADTSSDEAGSRRIDR